jgi:hypothetical protein
VVADCPAAQATLTPLGVHLVVALGSVDNSASPDAPGRPGPLWTATVAIGQLEAVGWTIQEVHEDRQTLAFSDIAALIGYVRSTPWAFEDLDWVIARPQLQQLHALSRSKPIEAVSHRFVVSARPTVSRA